MGCSATYVFDGSYNTDLSMCSTSSNISCEGTCTIPGYSIPGFDVYTPGFCGVLWTPTGWKCSLWVPPVCVPGFTDKCAWWEPGVPYPCGWSACATKEPGVPYPCDWSACATKEPGVPYPCDWSKCATKEPGVPYPCDWSGCAYKVWPGVCMPGYTSTCWWTICVPGYTSTCWWTVCVPGFTSTCWWTVCVPGFTSTCWWGGFCALYDWSSCAWETPGFCSLEVPSGWTCLDWVPSTNWWTPSVEIWPSISISAGLSVPLVINGNIYSDTSSNSPTEAVNCVTLSYDGFNVNLGFQAGSVSSNSTIYFDAGTVSYGTDGDFEVTINLALISTAVDNNSLNLSFASYLQFCIGNGSSWFTFNSNITLYDPLLNTSTSVSLVCPISGNPSNTYSTTSYSPVTAIVADQVTDSIFVTLTEKNKYIKNGYLVTGGGIDSSNIIVYDISGDQMVISQPYTIDANAELTFEYLSKITAVTTVDTSGTIVYLESANNSITLGQTVKGSGVSSGTTVTNIIYNSDPTDPSYNNYIVISLPSPILSGTQLTFEYLLNSITTYAVDNTTTIELANTFTNGSIVAGLDVSGNGTWTSNNTYVVDVSGTTLTVSSPVTLSEYTSLYFAYPIQITGYVIEQVNDSTSVTLQYVESTIEIGQTVTGTGITEDTTVANISYIDNVIFLSQNATIGQYTTLTFQPLITSTVELNTSSSTNVKLKEANSFIVIGYDICGNGILSATTVVDISGSDLTMSTEASLYAGTTLTFTAPPPPAPAFENFNGTVAASTSESTQVTLTDANSSIVAGLQVLCSGSISYTVTVVDISDTLLTLSYKSTLPENSVLTFCSSPVITGTVSNSSPGAISSSSIVNLNVSTTTKGIGPNWYITGVGVPGGVQVGSVTFYTTYVSVSMVTDGVSTSLVIPEGTVLTFAYAESS